MKLLALDVGNTRIHAGLFVSGRLTKVKHGPPYPRADVVAAATVRPSVKLPKGTQILTKDFPSLVRNGARRPESVGTDRLAAASAAYAQIRGRCVAVSVGTALTVNIVDARGHFIGGLISPGPALLGTALHKQTEMLPRVTPRRRRSVVGRDTRAAIEAGLSYGVEGILREVRRELGKVPIFGCGGDGAIFRDLFDEWRPHLVLEGIEVSYRNA